MKAEVYEDGIWSEISSYPFVWGSLLSEFLYLRTEMADPQLRQSVLHLVCFDLLREEILLFRRPGFVTDYSVVYRNESNCQSGFKILDLVIRWS